MTAANNIALFDMDGSLANYNKALVRDLAAIASLHDEPVNEDNIWYLADRQPWLRERMKLIKNQPGWWLNLEPIPDGLTILDWSRRFGYEIHILTKGPKKHSRAWKEKVEWCQRHIGDDVDIHITSDKGLVYGRVLYDDYPDYMLRWLKHRPRGLGIMPITPFNKDFSHPNVVMYRGVENIQQVFDALHVALRREPGQDLVLG